MEVSYFPRHSSGTPPFRLKLSPPFRFLNGRTTAWYSGYFANRPSSKRPGSLSKLLTRGTRARKRARTSSSIIVVTQLLLLRHPPNSTCTTPYDRKSADKKLQEVGKIYLYNIENSFSLFQLLESNCDNNILKTKDTVCTTNMRSFYAHIVKCMHVDVDFCPVLVSTKPTRVIKWS